MSAFKGERERFTLRLSTSLLDACRERADADGAGDLTAWIEATLANAISHNYAGVKSARKRKVA